MSDQTAVDESENGELREYKTDSPGKAREKKRIRGE